MPHVIKESHLETICASCKHKGEMEIEILHQHHKTYLLITCSKCNYKTIKLKEEIEFNNRFEFM